MKGYKENIEKLTVDNDYFRHVLYTGQHAQLVLMTIKPKGEIGQEVHETTDQFFRIETGEGKVLIDGEESNVQDGDAVIVPAGSEHNIINTSSDEPLKLYTIYSPPHHKDGIIHKTKEEADADTEDHL